MLLVSGDFNARNSSWWKCAKVWKWLCENDYVIRENTEIETLTCSYEFSQLIFYSTHLLQNASSRIDLVFTNQPNFVIESAAHPLLHPNHHHQIVFSKPNLKIENPPLYERLLWDYKSADSQSWEKLFYNKNIQDQLQLFNEPIVNSVHNYIPNKCIITCNEKDPHWLNNHSSILLKPEIFKKYLKKTWKTPMEES